VVAEGSRAIREFLAARLAGVDAIHLVAACSDGRELEAALASDPADVVVTDVRLPPSRGEEGLRIAIRLRERDPRIGVVLLGQYAEPAYLMCLLESGAGRAYILTERLAEKGELVKVVQAVAAGGIVIDPAIAEALVEARARVARSPLPRLAAAERNLLVMLVEGKPDTAIASSLGVTEDVVAAQVKAISAKLDLPDSDDAPTRTRQAVAYLAEEGD
jgi:DNA-binding NarL/FixJ family response regulator